jgi:hypothetical protein
MNSFFLLHGLTLALAWFLGVNAVATLLVVALAARLTRQDRIRTPRFWLCLRLLPAAVSIVAVIVVFLPSYWKYEPRDYDEGFNFTLVAAALVAFTLVARAVARGAAAWVRASNRARAWLQNAQPLTLPVTPLPAFAVEAEAPFVALVGVLRPRLFITRSVVDALTEEELAAGLGHEVGHWRRSTTSSASRCGWRPTLAGTVARDLEQRWASSAEHWADRHACEAKTVVDRGRAARPQHRSRAMAPAMVMTEPISTSSTVANRVFIRPSCPLFESRRDVLATPATDSLKTRGAASGRSDGTQRTRPRSRSTLYPESAHAPPPRRTF